MLEQIRYGGAFFCEGVRHVLKIKRTIHYDNVRCLDDSHVNLWLKEAVESGRPFMACRFGSGEMRAFLKTREVRMGLRKTIPEANMDSMCVNAGFFPREQEMVMRFGDLMEQSAARADMLAIWGTLPMEQYVIRRYLPQAGLCYLSGLEPFFAEEPWTMGWAGKKVLVIHPFETSIRRQYERKDEFQKYKQWLPDFELRTVKAVQTIGGGGDRRFSDWFQALDYMYEEAMKIDFDVAILGCGAYGFPLAARLKAAGKQAIHMGGVTQILFGIKGKRWVENPRAQLKFNDAWVFPKASETPARSGDVEGGCYW